MTFAKLLAMAGTVATLALTGCNFSPFELGGSSADGGIGFLDGGQGGDGGAGGADAMVVCTPTGPDDQCDEIDNDCNGVVDDNFDKQNDPDNCGSCGNRCIEPGSVLNCVSGNCEFIQCQPGFKDLDPATPGCEYVCPVFPEQAEDCNGIDEDCDGMVDEAADLPSPPVGLCRTTAGTPCAGVSMICATRGTPAVTTWYCDYPAQVEFDPTIPNGIVLQEQLCDGEDGDCDGAADDFFTDLGQECDNGAQGICRDIGERKCDPGDPTQTFCDLTVLPDPIGPSTTETCNGLDDNCDGMVDNGVVDDMVNVTFGGNDFYIYRYEASRPDATSSNEGALEHQSCSNLNVVPWRGVSHTIAAAACAATPDSMGVPKRLCTSAEYLAACAGNAANTFPYGATFDANQCNTEPFDGVAGGGDDDILLPTGSGLSSCQSDDGVFDLSGNLKEWTDDLTGQTPGGLDIHVLRGGAYNTPAVGATCGFRTSRAAVNTILPSIGFRCCSDNAP